MIMSLRGALFATKQSPLTSVRLLRHFVARNDKNRIENAIVEGNRELIGIYEEKVKKVIERVWEG